MALALELGSNSQFCQHVPFVSMRSENMTLYIKQHWKPCLPLTSCTGLLLNDM